MSRSRMSRLMTIQKHCRGQTQVRSSEQTVGEPVRLPGFEEFALACDPAHRLAAPLARAAGLLAHQPEVPHDDEGMGGLEVRRRDRTNRSIAVDERVPRCMEAPAERQLCPQEDREIVGEIAGATVVEVEEHRFSTVADARVEA